MEISGYVCSNDNKCMASALLHVQLFSVLVITICNEQQKKKYKPVFTQPFLLRSNFLVYFSFYGTRKRYILCLVFLHVGKNNLSCYLLLHNIL